MRPSTAMVAAATLLVGVVGGSVAYERASTLAASTPSSVSPTTAKESPARVGRAPRVRWAPCQAPAVLRGGTCVTAVVRTVVLPAPVAAATTTTGAAVVAAPTYQASVAAPVPGSNGGDDNGDDDDDDDRGAEGGSGGGGGGGGDGAGDD